MPHLPQPARARGRAFAPSVRRAKRPVAPAAAVEKPVRAKRIAVAMSEAPEAAPEMMAAPDGEN
jgi:hypothetical protein